MVNIFYGNYVFVFIIIVIIIFICIARYFKCNINETELREIQSIINSQEQQERERLENERRQIIINEILRQSENDGLNLAETLEEYVRYIRNNIEQERIEQEMIEQERIEQDMIEQEMIEQDDIVVFINPENEKPTLGKIMKNNSFGASHLNEDN